MRRRMKKSRALRPISASATSRSGESCTNVVACLTTLLLKLPHRPRSAEMTINSGGAPGTSDSRSSGCAVGSTRRATLLITRSAFRIWLANKRRAGHLVREILIIGANEEAADLIDLIADHPEAGYRVAGVVGSRADALEHRLHHLWKGESEDALAVIRGTNINGVVMVIGAINSNTVNDLVRELQEKDVHIHLSNGVRGINFRRLRAAPIVHEPLFYVEQSEMRRGQMIAKRALDLVVAVWFSLTAPSRHSPLIWTSSVRSGRSR